MLQITRACDLYAKDHGGAFPGDLQELFPEYVSDPQVYACPTLTAAGRVPDPRSNPYGPLDPDALCYCYVAGLKASDDKEFILAFDEEWNHERESVNVCYRSSISELRSDIAAVHAQLEMQWKELAARGRSMRIIRPAWSRWPERPQYPVTPLRERPLVIALVAAGGVVLATLAALLVIRRRRRRARENKT
jgi:hypothetical protein